ncbi:MAG: OadG family protein [Gemmatimonadetes bacterium]|jgi:Na+-transporting methylmalonyl-CoA/oxaloacetate decarboxylase gamma subunit|nr:OadG family protein [Gemmatimonadota bacterium]MBT6149150.1 OadG family protein [Gemmatimonadota bacterium]MBT7863937.1 OadG family protein [Gemmatimonadota bacterium]
MPEFESGIQSIIDGRGLPIAIVGMSIVFTALSAIAAIISLLPRVLKLLAKYVPEVDHHAPRERPGGPDRDLAAVAAAAAAYHTHRTGADS